MNIDIYRKYVWGKKEIYLVKEQKNLQYTDK